MIAVISYVVNWLAGWVVGSSIATIFHWLRPVYQTRIFNILYSVAIWATTWAISQKVQAMLRPIINQQIHDTAEEITKTTGSA